MRGIIIAGTHSGCGKTTVALGIMAALRKRGLAVQPFKTGPDFIDAGLHKLTAGRRSRNLDAWMCGKDYVLGCFRRHASDGDIAVIEGVMGMYDGDFSTAHLAELLQVPVILVVDAYGMAESAGAIVHGFVDSGFRVPGSGLKLSGVIFNRVASENHYTRLKSSVRDVPVLGYLPRSLNFEIPHRHLGLTVADENPLAQENIDKLAETVLHYINVDALIESARIGEGHNARKTTKKAVEFRIAVAYDKAFCFYYEDNLDMLQDEGAEIVFFSPLADESVPEGADAVYIGGGYPELHADVLAGNASMLASLRSWSEAGKPLYAECGGLMYLSQGIQDFENRFHKMTALFPFDTRMLRKPKLAYREIVLSQDCMLGAAGERLRGHEFHYSEIADSGQGTREEAARIYSVKDKSGADAGPEGFRVRNTIASYIHLHFGSNPGIAKSFVHF